MLWVYSDCSALSAFSAVNFCGLERNLDGRRFGIGIEEINHRYLEA